MGGYMMNELLGNTPMVEIKNVFGGANAKIYAKLEYYNPTFSIKDRAAYNMVSNAIKSGKIKKGDTIIEATSGNTGLGLCYAATKFGLNIICTVFDDVPVEKIGLLKAFGAKVIICPSKYESSGENGYVGVAKMLSEQISNSFYVEQFNNEDNRNAHYLYTGPEIFNQLEGKIDYFFATIGTGGTISGVGKYLKEKNRNIKVIGVEPIGGIYKDFFYNREMHYVDHLIQSISDDFVSPNFIKDYVDDVIQVADVSSFKMCYEILQKEGLCVGTSSGCVMAAIREYMKEKECENKNIVCVFPDNGLKYMDTLFNEEYLNEKKLLFEKEKNENKCLLSILKDNNLDVTIA